MLKRIDRVSILSRSLGRSFTHDREIEESKNPSQFRTIFSNNDFLLEGLKVKRKLGFRALSMISLTMLSFKFVFIPFWIVFIYFAADAMAKRTILKRLLKTSICRLEVNQDKPKMVRILIGPYKWELVTTAINIKTPMRKEKIIAKCDDFVTNPNSDNLDFSIVIRDTTECQNKENLTHIDNNYLVIHYSKERGDDIDIDEMIKLLAR
jgi:hypothetical protein